MPDSFDPYRKWLGISAHERPPSHYQLLGLEPFEADEETIGHAAERRIAYLRSLATSDHAELRRRILSELAAAKACLLNRNTKGEYDRRLRAALPVPPVRAPSAVRPPPITVQAAAPLDLAVETASPVVFRKRPRKARHTISQVALSIGALVILALPLGWLATRLATAPSENQSKAIQDIAAVGSTEMLTGKVVDADALDADESSTERSSREAKTPPDSTGQAQQEPEATDTGDTSAKSGDKAEPAEPSPLRPEPTETEPDTGTQPGNGLEQTKERRFSEVVDTAFIAAGGVERAGGYRPIRAELDATAESVKKIPTGLASPKYGILTLADRHWPVIVDEPMSRPPKLCVDTNGDGDLTNDPPTTWTFSTSNGPTKYQGEAQIDLGGGRMGTIHMYRFDPNDPQRVQLKNALFFYPDFGYELALTLDGQQFIAFLSGLPTANSPLAIDRDGNKRISGKRETVYVNKPFNYTGTTYLLTLNASQFSLAKASPSLPITPPPPDLTVGKQALPFTMAAIDGTTIEFPRQYAGQLVMLDFWSTWCPPCRIEVSNVTRAYEAWHNQGFEVLGVNFDDNGMADKLTAFTREKGMPWPQIYEGKMWATTLGELYDVNSIPFALLVDGDTGEILAAGPELRGPGLSDFIGKALAKKNGKTSPPLLLAPVAPDLAQRHQQAWAEHLQVPNQLTNSLGMTFMLIPPGDYALDAPPKAGRPVRRATTIARAFYLGAHEVTQEQCWEVTRTNPSFFAFGSGGARLLTGPSNQHPVEQVSWRDAVEFCNALSRLEGFPPYYAWKGKYANPLNTNGYRLASIDEWNCAASGGNDWEWAQTPATWGNFAWHQSNSAGRTWPVGQKQRNAFGLFDMYGNVWEYCAAPGSFRGYTYGSPALEMAIRLGPTNDIDFRANDVGFRVARTPQAGEKLKGSKVGRPTRKAPRKRAVSQR